MQLNPTFRGCCTKRMMGLSTGLFIWVSQYAGRLCDCVGIYSCLHGCLATEQTRFVGPSVQSLIAILFTQAIAGYWIGEQVCIEHGQCTLVTICQSSSPSTIPSTLQMTIQNFGEYRWVTFTMWSIGLSSLLWPLGLLVGAVIFLFVVLYMFVILQMCMCCNRCCAKNDCCSGCGGTSYYGCDCACNSGNDCGSSWFFYDNCFDQCTNQLNFMGDVSACYLHAAFVLYFIHTCILTIHLPHRLLFLIKNDVSEPGPTLSHRCHRLSPLQQTCSHSCPCTNSNSVGSVNGIDCSSGDCCETCSDNVSGFCNGDCCEGGSGCSCESCGDGLLQYPNVRLYPPRAKKQPQH